MDYRTKINTMKKELTLIIALFFLFSISATMAQIGIKGGLNFTNVSFEDANNNFEPDAKTGLHLGVFLDIEFSDFAMFRPGLIYNTRGYKLGNSTDSYNYFDVPLNIAVALGGKNNGLVIEAGPYFGLFINGDRDGTSLEGGKDINSTELGFNGGLNYEMSSGLGIGVNFKKGLSNINPNDGQADFKATNNIYSLFLMFKL
jgi:hypothetical protein